MDREGFIPVLEGSAIHHGYAEPGFVTPAGLQQRRKRLVLKASAVLHPGWHAVPGLQAQIIRVQSGLGSHSQHLHLRKVHAQAAA